MKEILRKPQIGVMGSAADLSYSKEVEQLAEETGFYIAQAGATLMFGAERDCDSLSTAACRGAKRAGGLTVGVTYGKGLDNVVADYTDIIIATGMERGGGREFVLSLSCDALIAISGGSGTLNELVVAYQANIPMVAIKATGGWSERLAGEYFDARKRLLVEAARTPQEAVDIAMERITARRKAI
ncbi:MAG: Rossmann fold nucleotide-binding protein [uncultured bacterium]|uniref:Rossmann fold nucleotide-binding protein n=1 Tax=Candidatus Daviesbacteria bacterium GW2011_GWC2_40_12 TaxID=1618431 RepID=A0A0G0T2X0_9BACT|nr:MAG: Rossmann fold nucleotide-binding protein [uncultured bacterium]KKQ83711.1 MAG: Rossmann fold nucleotide-binding protein [Candidatus Daviesbacteria bacterium GW2011_GWF2_38_7]KKR15713.1 MAG: Rossmann fold nucleotide-binding protein [Candidatus Daviesbacteria bacterium GW2011_GWA2_39_33]KKR24365.1 MAG: Rossmann fold nucleotide-binding protein [Candidatus Daviesbacteria bacterium GW2011_GWB1_39_5]KKR41450.1 MAG: Rossmann fold nucleotide-binding protein [Candidatus Daviesbacteria bacterium 